jgi:hypothetical protein
MIRSLLAFWLGRVRAPRATISTRGVLTSTERLLCKMAATETLLTALTSSDGC